jgi:alkylhydroperoxidase family enzyme
MTRLTPVQPEQTKDSVKGTLDELAARGGALGPMVLTMANSSALLRGYGIDAHSDATRGLGLTDTDIELARQGTATDPKVAAIVAFAQQVAAAPAEIADEDVETLRRFGYRDEQIADVVGLVALNVLTGSFNLVAGIEPADARQRCLSAV